MAGGPDDDLQLPFGAGFVGAAVKNADDDGSAEPAAVAVDVAAAAVVVVEVAELGETWVWACAELAGPIFRAGD